MAQESLSLPQVGTASRRKRGSGKLLACACASLLLCERRPFAGGNKAELQADMILNDPGGPKTNEGAL